MQCEMAKAWKNMNAGISIKWNGEEWEVFKRIGNEYVSLGSSKDRDDAVEIYQEAVKNELQTAEK